jgi:hypothetical protein
MSYQLSRENSSDSFQSCLSGSSDEKSCLSRVSSNSSEDQIIEECQAFIDILSDVFETTEDSIYIVVPEEINLVGDDGSVNINIFNKNTNTVCSFIEYTYDKQIFIHEISRCSEPGLLQGSGNDIIKKLIEVGYMFKDYLGKSERLNLIIDSDQSRIYAGGIKFELNWLYLFSNGETWYNSLGFKEDDYDAIQECIDPLITDDIKEKFKRIRNDIKRMSKSKTPDLNILRSYKRQLEDQKSRFLEEIKDRNCPIIHKFSNISYDLYEIKGGNKKRKIKSKKNTKKRKNKRKTKKI